MKKILVTKQPTKTRSSGQIFVENLPFLFRSNRSNELTTSQTSNRACHDHRGITVSTKRNSEAFAPVLSVDSPKASSADVVHRVSKRPYAPSAPHRTPFRQRSRKTGKIQPRDSLTSDSDRLRSPPFEHHLTRCPPRRLPPPPRRNHPRGRRPASMLPPAHCPRSVVYVAVASAVSTPRRATTSIARQRPSTARQ